MAPAAPRLRRGLRATRSVEARQGLPSWASPVTPAAPQTHLSRECPHLGVSERGTEQRGKSRSSFKVCTPRGSPGAGDRPGRPSGRRAQQAARPSTGGAARRPGRDGRGERGALGFGLEKGPDSCSWNAGSGRNPDSFEDDTSLFPSGMPWKGSGHVTNKGTGSKDGHLIPVPGVEGGRAPASPQSSRGPGPRGAGPGGGRAWGGQWRPLRRRDRGQRAAGRAAGPNRGAWRGPDRFRASRKCHSLCRRGSLVRVRVSCAVSVCVRVCSLCVCVCSMCVCEGYRV